MHLQYTCIPVYSYLLPQCVHVSVSAIHAHITLQYTCIPCDFVYTYVHTYVCSYSIDAKGCTALCTCACVSVLAIFGIYFIKLYYIISLYHMFPSPVCIYVVVQRIVCTYLILPYMYI